MNADLLRKLFQALEEGSTTGLRSIASSIIEEERRKGQDILASQLKEILDRKSNLTPSLPKSFPERKIERPALSSLPTSRHQEPLVRRVSPKELRSDMILSLPTEERFQRIEKEYAARQRLASFGLQPRKKILLYGPPGCGKTLAAERLARNAGLPLVKVRFDSIMSSFFGESATNLRNVFETSGASPCLLLLDECDFVARSRTNKNDIGEVPRIVNTLLLLLEEYNAPGLLVATTNLYDALDKAIFRRFDDVFEVPLPGQEEMLRLLRHTVASIQVANNIEWHEITAKLAGASAANIVKVSQDAAKTAVLRNDLPIRQEHFIEAIRDICHSE